MSLTFTDTPLYYKDSQGQYQRILSGADMTGYRTAAAQDTIDAGKQAKIAASGMLKGDGAGGVTAATAGTDYQAPLIAGTDYETPAGAKALGLTGASVGDLVRVNAVDANGKPTSWKHVPLCDIVTNQNLLDNWYFVGGGSQLGDGVFPINQRGQTIYNGAGYGIDRWIYGEQTINSDENVTVSGTMYQRIAAYTAILDGVTTFSALTTSGLITASGIARNGYSATQGNGVGYDSNMNIIYVAVANCTVIAVKLELGSEQTLAHQENGVWVLNEIPDYREELAKCQRYYLDTGLDFKLACPQIIDSRIWFSIPTPVPMRTIQSVSLGIIDNYTINASTYQRASAVEFNGQSPIGVELKATFPANAYDGFLIVNGLKISAEL